MRKKKPAKILKVFQNYKPQFIIAGASLLVLVVALIGISAWQASHFQTATSRNAPDQIEYNGDNTYTAEPTLTPTVTSLAMDTVAPTSPSPTPSPSATATAKPTTKTPVPTTKAPTATPAPTTVAPTATVIDYSRPWTVAPGCPATTQNCIPCTSDPATSFCRKEPGQTHGFLGWSCQDNNPGNIRNASTNMASDFKNQIIVRNGGQAACGVRYDSRGGSYFVFASYDAGMGALKAYIRGINNGEHSSYTGCGDCTLTFFFGKYAPNDSNYDDAVGAEIGVDPTTTTLRTVVQSNLDGFAAAIKNHEGWFSN